MRRATFASIMAGIVMLLGIGGVAAAPVNNPHAEFNDITCGAGFLMVGTLGTKIEGNGSLRVDVIVAWDWRSTRRSCYCAGTSQLNTALFTGP